MRIDLSPELAHLIEAYLASGRYREHVLSEALRTLELSEPDDEHQANDVLRQLIAEGEASGDPEPYDMAAVHSALDRERPGRA